MTEKEKAQELIKKYSTITGWSIQSLNGWMLKEMARTCVDEILNFEINSFGDKTLVTKYWKDVKTEIEKL